ncbi:methyltransferase family protein [Arenicella xantha]|uniref:Protein-S-isoprenylcysteine O-methyltransferase Ste14 n=1 Tax=Arenicella xantha TaxID=644221 RepID=A0A395JGU4_9GAMM|nr:isoprenylcysteine carboxylmethyltransferase family protein [Arenicella xantha]RBP48612.1 protein-S-isoprenylcysteine O-methyltransferase Ste14 [Arenicella xantha]
MQWQWLEHRVPPPIVLLLSLLLIVLLAYVDTARHLLFSAPLVNKVIALACAIIGVTIAVLGVVSFRRAHTTVNPLRPASASQLVQFGIFRFSRNPMYLGMVFVAMGCAIWLGSVFSWLGVLLFVVFITRFQIVPEERAMQDLFGDSFTNYRRKVRRWL